MSVKTYKYNNSSKVTEHFKVSEFRCKCGATHDTLISQELVDRLEKLRTNLNCSKIIINSGYRCSKHDKNVGGSGSGQHTTGKAVDVVCYDSSGKTISSKRVCCVAQDIGFNGIANIDKTYTATHLDVASRKWYGDETITTSKSVTDDFYKYYGYAKKSKNITIIIDGVKYTGTVTAK